MPFTHITSRLAAAGLLMALAAPVVAQNATSADLDAIKTYLLGKTADLSESTATLVESAQAYYDLAVAYEFDYQAVAADPAAIDTLEAARAAWIVASPLYEQMEGIVAGVPSLAEYDVIMDAGVSGEEDPVDGVPFDLVTPDGRTFERPGNLFGVTESTLWATREAYSAGVFIDLDADAEQAFGEILPDANVLLAGAELLHQYAVDLDASAHDWEPTETDAFTALVVMVPTMSEYFGSWKESRFIAGDAGGAEFVAISRLSDIQDILGGLEVVYDGVSPRVADAGSDYAEAIGGGLTDLRAYVADLYAREQDGHRFTAEEADFFGSEAQDRAAEITGQIAQVAALLDIELAE